jgi:hypothetical protein
LYPGLARDRVLDRQHRRQGRNLGRQRGRTGERRVARLAHHDRERLTGALDQSVGQQHLADAGIGEVVAPRNVRGQQQGNHARHRTGRRRVEGRKPAMRDRRECECGMQQAMGLREVVQEARLAGGVLQGAVVQQGGAHSAPGGGLGVALRDGVVHNACTSAGRSGRVIRQ